MIGWTSFTAAFLFPTIPLYHCLFTCSTWLWSNTRPLQNINQMYIEGSQFRSHQCVLAWKFWGLRRWKVCYLCFNIAGLLSCRVKGYPSLHSGNPQQSDKHEFEPNTNVEIGNATKWMSYPDITFRVKFAFVLSFVFWSLYQQCNTLKQTSCVFFFSSQLKTRWAHYYCICINKTN